MASATATANPDGGLGRPRRPRFGGSRIGRLILALNLLGLAVLIGGALVLNELRRGLITARIDSLTTQGQFIAKVLDETATVGDPAPALEAQQAAAFLQLLFIPRSQRARLFDAQGNLIADSYAVADRVEQRPLPPARKPGERSMPFMSDAAPRAPAVQAQDQLHAEIAQARQGRQVAGLRLSDNGRRVVSVSIPIQHVRAVLGVLTLEAGDVDQIIAAERKALLPFILIAVAVTLTSSLLLHRLIAVPVIRLARAADQVRLSGARAISLPDIAERQDEIGALSRSLEEMTEALSERMDAIERFAADVSHEIKNPLTSIRSAVETLDLVTDDKARARLLAILNQDVGRLDRLVTDISNASRLDAELSRESPRLIDLGRLLGDIAGLYEARGEAAPENVRVRLVGDGLPDAAPVRGRETPLGQVFRNLIDNARSFSPDGGEVRIALSRRRGGLVVTVEDDGPGIPPDNLETVFERFYTSRPKGRAFGGNSGLGLSIARQIIDAHDGEIHAENRKDEAGRVIGARFVVTLPAAAL